MKLIHFERTKDVKGQPSGWTLSIGRLAVASAADSAEPECGESERLLSYARQDGGYFTSYTEFPGGGAMGMGWPIVARKPTELPNNQGTDNQANVS